LFTSSLNKTLKYTTYYSTTLLIVGAQDQKLSFELCSFSNYICWAGSWKSYCCVV